MQQILLLFSFLFTKYSSLECSILGRYGPSTISSKWVSSSWIIPRDSQCSFVSERIHAFQFLSFVWRFTPAAMSPSCLCLRLLHGWWSRCSDIFLSILSHLSQNTDSASKFTWLSAHSDMSSSSTTCWPSSTLVSWSLSLSSPGSSFWFYSFPLHQIHLALQLIKALVAEAHHLECTRLCLPIQYNSSHCHAMTAALLVLIESLDF